MGGGVLAGGFAEAGGEFEIAEEALEGFAPGAGAGLVDGPGGGVVDEVGRGVVGGGDDDDAGGHGVQGDGALHACWLRESQDVGAKDGLAAAFEVGDD